MFPLGTVLFPYALLPLHVFESRYRVMTRRVMAGDREFGVVLIERGSEVGGGDARFDVGTIARIVRADELPDGRFALATVGLRRVRVVEWLPDDPFPQAVTEPIAEPPATPGDAEARERVVAALSDVAALVARIDPREHAPLPELATEPVRASWEAAALAPIGVLDAQRVLATDAAGDRLAVLADLLDGVAHDLRARLE
jgi:Lon protease-like protein